MDRLKISHGNLRPNPTGCCGQGAPEVQLRCARLHLLTLLLSAPALSVELALVLAQPLYIVVSPEAVRLFADLHCFGRLDFP